MQKTNKEEENSENKTDKKENTFLIKLKEYKKRIILSLSGIVLACIIVSVFINQIIDYILLNPVLGITLSMQNIRPLEQTFSYFRLIIIGGLITALPFILYLLWKIIKNISKDISEKKEIKFIRYLKKIGQQIIYSFSGFLLGCVVTGIFINQIIAYLKLNPALAVALSLQNINPLQQPFSYFKLIIIGGLIIAFPFLLFQLWKLIKNISKHKSEENINDKEMNLFDHIEELRKRIILSLVGIIIGCIISGIFINQIMDYILLNPAINANLKLQNLHPFGQPIIYFKVIIFGGLLLSFPFILYQLWKFIAPGLYLNEKSWVGRIVFFTTFCFLSGVFFSYYVMVPSMFQVSATFGNKNIINNFDINLYFGFLTTMVLALGLVFEMPMVAYVLARVGILKPKFLKDHRKHSIVAILIIAAVLTPSTDPFSQLIFAAPLFVLYEISIIITKLASIKYHTEPEQETTT